MRFIADRISETVDITRALDLIEKAVVVKGAAHTADARYISATGEPTCIVALALMMTDNPNVQSAVLFEGRWNEKWCKSSSLYIALSLMGMKFTAEAHELLMFAQALQDCGMAWGRVLGILRGRYTPRIGTEHQPRQEDVALGQFDYDDVNEWTKQAHLAMQVMCEIDSETKTDFLLAA